MSSLSNTQADSQYTSFRNQLLLLTSVACGHVAANMVLQLLGHRMAGMHASALERMKKWYYLLFSVAFIGILHGGA
jgi:hypothetical protein